MPPETQTDELEPVLKSLEADDILAYVNSLFNRARQNRLRFEQQWYLNMAFYFGKQNVVWQPGISREFARLYEPKVPPWRARVVANRIRPLIRTELAKITKERPQAFVVPASTDDNDLHAARAGERIFDHLWRELNINRVKRRAVFWMLLCGTSFIKDWWDKEKKDNSGTKGSICTEPVTAFHLYVPDTQEEEIENQPFVIHALAKDKEWVKKRYDVDVSEETSTGPGVLEQKFLAALGAQSPRKFVPVREIWIKPNEKFEKGAVIHWTGERLLQVHEGWPYKHNEYPFSKLDHIPTGRFYADSVIADLIPLQKEYNRTRSQIIEAKNRMAKPQLIAPRGSVNPNKMTTEPGLIIEYTPGFQPPTPLPIQNLPGYVIEELERCLRDMDDISAQHEITKGRTPPGVTAATAIAYLQEEDDSKLAATISSLEEAVEKLGRHCLVHVQQFWKARRMIRVVGDNNVFESFMYTQADLRNNSDLHVEPGSATPRSKAAKEAFITELGKMGWIPPDRALRYLDMAETGRLYEESQLDARHAQRENLRLQQGDPIMPNTWDNHEIHLMEHNNFRKKQQFEHLPEEVKVQFEQHVQTHQQVQQQNQMQAMMQMMSQGQGGQLSGGSEGGSPGSSQQMPPPPMMGGM